MISTNPPALTSGKPLLPKCQSYELLPAWSKFPEFFTVWSTTICPACLMDWDLLDAAFSHKVFVDIVPPHYGKSLRNHYAKNALSMALSSCGCNLVAGNNEEGLLACDQPALQRLLSNALGTTAWQLAIPAKSQIHIFPNKPHSRTQQVALSNYIYICVCVCSCVYICIYMFIFVYLIIISVYIIMQYYGTDAVSLAVLAVAADCS